MNVAAWNVRGFNDPSKHREVTCFISSNNISLLGILESRVRHPNLDQLLRSINNYLKCYSNHSVATLRRILVIWDPSLINFIPIFVNDQAIHGKVLLSNNFYVFVSFVYGVCDSNTRRSLWVDLIHCAAEFKDQPWVILGDFNVSRFGKEHNSSNRVTKAMTEFNNTMRTVELDDLKGTGFKFTWSNMRRGSEAIMKKLDRTLGNWQWFNLLGDTYARSMLRGSRIIPQSLYSLCRGSFAAANLLNFLILGPKMRIFFKLSNRSGIRCTLAPL
ncbi:Exo_endo_phos domain-containing protein [Cephalotus follicularis]|uniref:Exo_endo_phos domain-containing protein n=1 Tax=Cephalotus follicularis TaxID=3775 RepID=A0A1Q3CEW1_CEPFO|nr:Exo_endo_phos domain-containing protein [Cephalotus follicularis]